jgi:pyruvate dehydrogenase E2 component (dihydrolipoamide acetyltransferase)
MAQDTGKLIRWLKNDGEAVTKGEPLMEVETDKATVEVESPATGILAAVTASSGDDITVGRAIALILAPGETPAAVAPPAASTRRAAAAVPPDPSGASTSAPAPSRPAGPAGRPQASPKARRLAAEKGVDLAQVLGTGPGGAVLEEDVLQAGAIPGGPAAEPALWRAMAENVTRSWTSAPHFYVVREVDATGLQAERSRHPQGVTYTDLMVKAAAAALARHPRVNGSQPGINIGLAVALPDGLIVPVIHDAVSLSIPEIAARRRELVERVKAGRVRASDVSGGTFTLSNLGMYGVDLFTAILTEGQAGILAVGRIVDRVVARDGAAVVRPMVTMSLSCDHRRVDGARAAEFVRTLAELLESPAGL